MKLKKVDENLLNSIKKVMTNKGRDIDDESVIDLTEVVHSDMKDLTYEQKKNQIKLLSDINDSIAMLDNKDKKKKKGSNTPADSVNEDTPKAVKTEASSEIDKAKLKEIIKNTQIINRDRDRKMDRDAENPRLKVFFKNVLTKEIQGILHDNPAEPEKLSKEILDLLQDVIEREIKAWLSNNIEEMAHRMLQNAIDDITDS
ncbi:hypothetical protein GUI12_00880 [Anaplasmataceae bacterium AB001_6]|nr:hypothetical protein GUI12_00880 [Anaplasmataceae bacterium AB001_6]